MKQPLEITHERLIERDWQLVTKTQRFSLYEYPTDLGHTDDMENHIIVLNLSGGPFLTAPGAMKELYVTYWRMVYEEGMPEEQALNKFGQMIAVTDSFSFSPVDIEYVRQMTDALWGKPSMQFSVRWQRNELGVHIDLLADGHLVPFAPTVAPDRAYDASREVGSKLVETVWELSLDECDELGIPEYIRRDFDVTSGFYAGLVLDEPLLTTNTLQAALWRSGYYRGRAHRTLSISSAGNQGKTHEQQ